MFLATLFHKYRGSLYRYLSGLVSSPEDAAELVQESYTRLLQQENVAQLEAVSRTYLFQIATNLARDHFRRRTTRHSGAHFDVDDVEIADERAAPEHDVVWEQTIDSIKQGIKELPPVTRRVFLLSRFRNKTYPQIAAMLGVSTRTVERKMCRGHGAAGRPTGRAQMKDLLRFIRSRRTAAGWFARLRGGPITPGWTGSTVAGSQPIPPTK